MPLMHAAVPLCASNICCPVPLMHAAPNAYCSPSNACCTAPLMHAAPVPLMHAAPVPLMHAVRASNACCPRAPVPLMHAAPVPLIMLHNPSPVPLIHAAGPCASNVARSPTAART